MPYFMVRDKSALMFLRLSSIGVKSIMSHVFQHVIQYAIRRYIYDARIAKECRLWPNSTYRADNAFDDETRISPLMSDPYPFLIIDYVEETPYDKKRRHVSPTGVCVLSNKFHAPWLTGNDISYGVYYTSLPRCVGAIIRNYNSNPRARSWLRARRFHRSFFGSDRNDG